jgi:hypothetical protein
MKRYKMPFEYWEDADYKLILKTKDPRRAVDRDFWQAGHTKYYPQFKYPLFVNDKEEELLINNIDRWKEYHNCEDLVDKHEGEPAYIFCPGPTMAKVDANRFKDRVTIAVNSAGYAFNPTYWLFAEAGYARWCFRWKQSWTPEQRKKPILTTTRASAFLSQHETVRGIQFDDVYVLRWDDEYIIPARCQAPSTMNALTTAWQMGCNPCYVIGLDLSKDAGPYIEGVPFTRKGARNPFDDQIKCLSQFQAPGFRVVNGSPASKDSLPFEYMSYEEINGTI